MIFGVFSFMDSIHADVVHHLAYRIEIHAGTIIQPCPEHGILLNGYIIFLPA